MQRPLGISAHSENAPDNRDASLRLSAGLNRLATLRATLRGDWSDGPASLLAFATADGAHGDGLRWATARPAAYAAPSLEPASVVAAPAVAAPTALRGRFETTDDQIPLSIDQSWLDLVGDVSVFDAPMAIAIPAKLEDAAEAFGEIAVAIAFAEDCATIAQPPSAPDTPPQPAAVEIDDIDPTFAIGAAPDLLRHWPAPDAPVVPPAEKAAIDVVDEAVVVASGAVADVAALFDTLTPIEAVAAKVTPHALESADDDIDLCFGAAPALAALLDAVPAFEPVVLQTRPFDPMSLIDDALADAFEALVCAPDPIDPLEAAWTPDAFADTNTAAHLAACETALWALPRHTPCIETFLLTPNHETAVRLTRALRVRADALKARAFTESAGFGFLQSEADATALWFMADALADTGAAGDMADDANFAAWQVNADGLIVITAPAIAPPRRAAPLISEAELDALFAHVDASQSRVLLDDMGDDPTWNETFWHDVDSYLERVSEAMDPAVIEEPPLAESDFDMHDLDVRTATPQPPAGATYFWMPGDVAERAVAGDGADLFIVGADDEAAVVLIEDGATYAMRTGKDARMDEVVVSLSADPWRDIDGMDWRRIAVLSGVAQIRVTQNAALTRCAVVAGTYFATALDDDGVRLVLAGAEGDQDTPIIRVGGLAPIGWATLDEDALV